MIKRFQIVLIFILAIHLANNAIPYRNFIINVCGQKNIFPLSSKFFNKLIWSSHNDTPRWKQLCNSLFSFNFFRKMHEDQQKMEIMRNGNKEKKIQFNNVDQLLQLVDKYKLLDKKAVDSDYNTITTLLDARCLAPDTTMPRLKISPSKELSQQLVDRAIRHTLSQHSFLPKDLDTTKEAALKKASLLTTFNRFKPYERELIERQPKKNPCIIEHLLDALDRDDLLTVMALIKNDGTLLKFEIPSSEKNGGGTISYMPLVSYAVSKNALNSVHFLITAGAPLTGYKSQNLNKAVKNNNMAMLKLLLQAGDDVDASVFQDVIAKTDQEESLKIMQLLVDYDADFDIHGQGWYTPAHYAVEQKNLKVLQFLVDRNVKMQTTVGDRNTPLDLAFKSDNYKAAEIILSNSSYEKLIKPPSYNLLRLINTKEKFDLLIARGLIVDHSLLERVLQDCDQTILEEFIQWILDKLPQNTNLNSPLHQAINISLPLSILKLLINAGADVNSDVNRLIPLTAIDYNLGEEAPAIVQLFIDNGADVNKPDGRDITPLQHVLSHTFANCSHTIQPFLKTIILSLLHAEAAMPFNALLPNRVEIANELNALYYEHVKILDEQIEALSD